MTAHFGRDDHQLADGLMLEDYMAQGITACANFRATIDGGTVQSKTKDHAQMAWGQGSTEAVPPLLPKSFKVISDASAG